MTSHPITVLAVDDHPILRRGIVAVIEEAGDMRVVGEASTATEALEIFSNCRPDVVLMDLQLPDLSGLEAIISLRRGHPTARVIVLTTYEGDVLARRALKAGAVGYLLKSMIRKDLVDAIRVVHAGKKHIPQTIAASLPGDRGP
jgi:DNA-binding NarL/FixJ family response regulator